VTDFSKDSDSVQMRIDGTGEVLKLWSEYSYTSEFLEPTDDWSFSIGDPNLARDWVPKLPPMTRVTLEINGLPTCAGYVKGWEIMSARGGGRMMRVTGFDALGPMCRSGVDPLLKFTAGMSLLDLITTVASKFGFKVIATTDAVNRNLITGASKKTGSFSKTVTSTSPDTYGATTSTSTSIVSDATSADLKAMTLQQAQPHPAEGAFEFLARHCKRFGLWLWASPLGDTLTVGRPDFDQEPLYSIHDGSYIDAKFAASGNDQPTVIIADGKVRGDPNFPKAISKIAMINELTGLDAHGKIRSKVQAIINSRKGCKVLPLRPQVTEWSRYFPAQSDDCVTAMYMHDDESTSIVQLEGYVRKEMGVRQGKALSYHVTVEDHVNSSHVWAVNTTCRLDDRQTGASGVWWIRSRTLTKSRGGGTMTSLEMVPTYLLEIGK